MAPNDSHPNPKYRRQKGRVRDRAFVVLDGKRHYLGTYGSPESKQRYHRLIAEWWANGRRLRPDPHDLTIVELAAAYWDHAQRYYRKPDGRPTSTQHRIRMALRGLRRLYAETRAGVGVDSAPAFDRCPKR